MKCQLPQTKRQKQITSHVAQNRNNRYPTYQKALFNNNKAMPIANLQTLIRHQISRAKRIQDSAPCDHRLQQMVQNRLGPTAASQPQKVRETQTKAAQRKKCGQLKVANHKTQHLRNQHHLRHWHRKQRRNLKKIKMALAICIKHPSFIIQIPKANSSIKT